MPPKIDKNIIKQYFRSGSRPTQNQFYELIDNCYNEGYTSFVSGYQLLPGQEKNQLIKEIKREAGRTILIPHFNRINTIHSRTYHYAIPLANIASALLLDKITIDMILPQSAQYTVKDSSREVRINQQIKVDYIKIFNGSEEIFETLPDIKSMNKVLELSVKAPADYWKGIAVDIALVYDITSDIAVSDQFDISSAKGDMLQHSFGTAGCIFKPND